MVSPEWARMMARYTAWQSDSIAAAADTLSDAERVQDRGAFFGSIAGTLNHLLWGDRIWMSRFAGIDAPAVGSIPESVGETGNWTAYRAARTAMDQTILDWTATLEADWFAGDLTWYSGAVGREVSKPKALLAVHFFNHGTHHRGQTHAMLTAAGARPEDSDLPFMPSIA